MENHFSAGEASLEEKERALYAEAAPREKTLLLHSPDGREAESSEQPAAGAPAAGPGSAPEASLSNASASESAAPGGPAGPGEEEAGPPGASTLPPDGEGQPGGELGLGEGPGQEGAAGEAEGQAGRSVVPGEAEEVLGEHPEHGAAVGTAQPEGSGAFPGPEVKEVHAPETQLEDSSGPDQELEVPDGISDVDTETQEGAEGQGEPSPSPASEAGTAQSSKAGGTQEDHPPEGLAPGLTEEGLDEASSEEESGDEEGGGAPSEEESEEDSGDRASSEEAGGTSEEAGEPQEAAGTVSPGEEGAQLSSKELNTGPEAEERKEGPQGRGLPGLLLAPWAAALILEDACGGIGRDGVGVGALEKPQPAPGLLGGGPARMPGSWGAFRLLTGQQTIPFGGTSGRLHHGGPRMTPSLPS